MAKQTIFRGTSANDGTGDNLRRGAQIINENFDELYTALGDGSTLTTGTYITTTSTATLSNKTISGSNNTLTDIANSSLVNSTITIGDDTSTNFNVSLGGSFEIVGGSGINTAINNNRIELSTDGSIVTESSSDILTNKSIALGSNTITGTTAEFNTALTDNDFATLTGSEALENKTISGANNSISNIANSSLVNSSITLGDDTSTNLNVNLGESFEIVGGTNVNTAIDNRRLTIGLTNNSITLGSDTINLGDTTTTITGLSLDGSATINLTGSGNRLKFNFTNLATLESTYPNESGQFGIDESNLRPYVGSSSGYIRILTENDSVSTHADVNISGVNDGYILSWSSAQGRFNVIPNTATTPVLKFSDDTSTVGRVNADDVQILGFVGGTNISTVVDDANNTVTINNTLTFTTDKSNVGDGSTVNFTINSGRTVDDILVFVNGICLVPTDDYTVSGTTLGFTVAPAASSEIVIRYLG